MLVTENNKLGLDTQVFMVFSSSYSNSSKHAFYIQAILRELIPSYFYKRRKEQLLSFIDNEDIDRRVNYYLKKHNHFSVTSDAKVINEFKNEKPSAYYYDLKQYLKYFPSNLKFNHRFGDETHLESYPFFVKARPINGNNENAVLINLDKNRHFHFLNDPYTYEQKKDLLVWRGAAYQEHRKRFIQEYYLSPLCNVGQTNKPVENVPWQKDKLSIDEQLQYKFILSIEGNDVATSLKWTLSSNSLCLMVKPKFETWFMEGTLIPGVHYVELNEDYSDLEDKIQYYLAHPQEAKLIIKNAHKYIDQFQNPLIEDAISISVMQRYFELSNQICSST
ncbi:glycosyl transferase family 90 [Vibrio scophthalmi]|uniref:Putative lipopolysaccharide A protein n=1 Tax=Vibrio scophthalmi LMG 19158 TaxID=870967 RepID=F9RQ35_9VIBR|nr:glycosyl transferase family 90 [Vibrio scophthalmi]EGU34637.1 putative lipopolysaccharide A protein [Vibrio scophthalmi LMG 19158]